MPAFESVKLTWHDRVFDIPPNKLLGAIARIEDFLTLAEITRFALAGSAPLAKIAQAYAAVLTYAGAHGVTADDVYYGMFSGDPGDMANAQNAIATLLGMMVPPGATIAATEAPANLPPADAPSSKPPTRRRSDNGASSRVTSGR